MKKVFLMFVLIFSLTFSGSLLAFTDVNDQNIHSKAINYLKENEVLDGYPDGSFRSENPMTRAEFSKLIVVSEKFVLSGDAQINFTDTKGHWAEEYIKILVSHKLIKGYPDGSFKPEKNITFAEAVTIVARLLDIEEEGKNIVWPNTYIDYATEKEILKNVSFNSGDENLAIKRGNVAEIVYNKTNYDIAQKELEEKEKEEDKKEENKKPSGGGGGSSSGGGGSLSGGSSSLDNVYKKQIVYDFETQKLDLGGNWKKLKLKNDDGTFYVPTDRYVTNRKKDKELVYKGSVLYKEVETPNIFADIKYDAETETLDLGENWDKYKLSICLNNDISNKRGLYDPSQRVINAKEPGFYEEGYTAIMLKANTEANMMFTLIEGYEIAEKPEVLKYIVSDFNNIDESIIDLTGIEVKVTYQNQTTSNANDAKNIFINKEIVVTEISGDTAKALVKLNDGKYSVEYEIELKKEAVDETISYDFDTQILDLGENWNTLKIQNKNGTFYIPSQRYLTNRKQNTETLYKGDYLYKTVETPYIFDDIKYDFEAEMLDLGENWDKYSFNVKSSHRYSKGNKGNYTASQRKIADSAPCFYKKGYTEIILNANPDVRMLFSLIEGYEILEKPDALKYIVQDFEDIDTSILDLKGLNVKISYEDGTSIERKNLGGAVFYSRAIDIIDEEGDFATGLVTLSDGKFKIKYMIDLKKEEIDETISYDFDTQTLDLGENWDSLKLKNKNGTFYEPTQRYLINRGNNSEIIYSGDYYYLEIDTPYIFDDVYYDDETETLDLGENWDKYKLNFSLNAKQGSIVGAYAPSQRELNNSSNPRFFKEGYTEIILIDNPDVRMQFYLIKRYSIAEEPDALKYIVPDFNNIDEGLIDLTGMKVEIMYEDKTTSNSISVENIFPDRYIEIIDEEGDYATALVTLSDGKYSVEYEIELKKEVVDETISYDFDTQKIDFGENWSSLKLKNKNGTFYKPSQRYLTNRGNSSEIIYSGDYYYLKLDTPSILTGIYYDSDDETLNLGKYWDKFEIEFKLNDSYKTQYGPYTPTQRILTKPSGDNPLFEQNETNCYYHDGYTIIRLKANTNVRKTFTLIRGYEILEEPDTLEYTVSDFDDFDEDMLDLTGLKVEVIYKDKTVKVRDNIYDLENTFIYKDIEITEETANTATALVILDDNNYSIEFEVTLKKS